MESHGWPPAPSTFTMGGGVAYPFSLEKPRLRYAFGLPEVLLEGLRRPGLRTRPSEPLLRSAENVSCSARGGLHAEHRGD